jgi:hypothetical protein
MTPPVNKEESELMNTPTIETWMPEARKLAAQCWCDPETQDREMDVVLAEAVARRIAAWMDAAAMFNRNSDFYRGIVVQIGEMFGEAAKTSDDGSVQQDVLALKVPELVASLRSALAAAQEEIGTFKAFHKNLCERFGCVHDETDWRRDLCSLEEHIALQIKKAEAALAERKADTNRLDWWIAHPDDILVQRSGIAAHVLRPVILGQVNWSPYYDNVRVAIDAAMN